MVIGAPPSPPKAQEDVSGADHDTMMPVEEVAYAMILIGEPGEEIAPASDEGLDGVDADH